MCGGATIEDKELRKIDDELVLTVSGTVPIEVEGYMDKHVYYSEDDFEDVHVSDADWNDHVMQVSTTVETAFELSLIYSPQSKSVVGYSLTLPNETENDWYK